MFVYVIWENINSLGSITWGTYVIEPKSLIFSILHEKKQGVTNLAFSKHALLNSINIILFNKNKERMFLYVWNSHANSSWVRALWSTKCQCPTQRCIHNQCAWRDVACRIHTDDPYHTTVNFSCVIRLFIPYREAQTFKSPVWYGNILFAC